MEFFQLIDFKSELSAEDLIAMEVRWRDATRGRRTNVIEWFLIDRADPTRKVAVNGFATHDDAMRNSNLPETDQLARQIGEVVSDMAFREYDFVDQAAEERDALARGLASALATGRVPDDVFAEDVLFDLNVPLWRYQLQGADALAALVTEGEPGAVESARVTPTIGGFVLELAFRVPGDDGFYCRQLCVATTRGGLIAEVTVYCTGEWDRETERRQHAEAPMVRG